jgi:hypothetical protein
MVAFVAADRGAGSVRLRFTRRATAAAVPIFSLLVGVHSSGPAIGSERRSSHPSGEEVREKDPTHLKVRLTTARFLLWARRALTPRPLVSAVEQARVVGEGDLVVRHGFDGGNRLADRGLDRAHGFLLWW